MDIATKCLTKRHLNVCTGCIMLPFLFFKVNHRLVHSHFPRSLKDFQSNRSTHLGRVLLVCVSCWRCGVF